MEFKSEDPQNQNRCPPPGFYYPWSSHGSRNKEAKIAGDNGFDKLDIAVFNWPGNQNSMLTPELAKDGYNRDLMFPLPKGIYYVKIKVGSKSIPFKSEEVTLKLTYSGDVNMQIEKQ